MVYNNEIVIEYTNMCVTYAMNRCTCCIEQNRNNQYNNNNNNDKQVDKYIHD